MKIICMHGAGAGGEHEDLEVQFVFPEDSDNVKAVPRINVNSIVGDNSKVLHWEL